MSGNLPESQRRFPDRVKPVLEYGSAAVRGQCRYRAPDAEVGRNLAVKTKFVAAGLQRLGWTEEVLKAKRKGHPGKVDLVRQLRAHTTMPMSWVAERLSMGSRGYLAWLLGQRKKRPATPPEGQGLFGI